MTIEEVYAHFQVPLDDTTNEMFTTNYTKEAVKRLKRQKGALNAKLETMINEMIINRKYLVENVFKFTNKNNVHLPVNFKRILLNLQHHLDSSPFCISCDIQVFGSASSVLQKPFDHRVL